MPRIFGIDIAGIVRANTRGQLFTGILSRRVQGTTKNFVFEGVPVIDKESQNIQALSKSGQANIMIIAESILPKTIPRIKDEILLNDKRYSISTIETDPAEATHTCVVSVI